ncbi:MAG: DUF4248 domain-containing protein [Prevotella sp.]|nr:DUF4248 domain-containing protein [Prevotella sp.]
MLEVKDYSKQELADLLYPHTRNPQSRLKQIWREVTGCPDLVQVLNSLHWNPHSHRYTRRQVAAIKEMLCLD